MSVIDNQFKDYMMQDALGLLDDNDSSAEFDDGFLLERRQRPKRLGGVDWRYEKGGVFDQE